MAEKINHGKSKMISSYGGVGSVIDTPDASIIIETFDKWGYPSFCDQEIQKHIILDDRLVNRLRTRFPKLKHLVSIPVEEDGWKTDVQPQANYFPKWFYCPNCHRFMNIKDWKKHWQGRQEFDLQCFNPECKGEHLEQVRFVMTCDNGHIHDLPWEFWNNRKIIETHDSEDENSDAESKIQIDFDCGKCCENPDLRYIVSQENTDLSGIHIKCGNCKKSATLKGVFSYSQKCSGLKYWNGFKDGQPSKEECDKRMAVKIKTSNSIYYSNTLSSLWIPEKQILNLTPEVRTRIDAIVNDEEFEQKDLEKFSRQNNIPIEIINQYLDGSEISYIPDIVYRQAEYDYFINPQQREDKSIKFRQINVKDKLDGFDLLVKIDRLKKITAQTSFTRNQPIDTDSILIDPESGNYQYKVKPQSVSANSFETRLLPAVENYGEGILFVLDEQKLIEWENNEIIKQRIEKIKNNATESDWQIHKIKAKTLTAREMLIHTLSHLFIREFEYVCGYPMSSLQERLYVSPNMKGFLISAYDGTDGYLGGLTKLCNNLEKLQNIIKSALMRAKDCSLDPICYESEGQGVAQLNLAACHSCTLVPDTSCEMSNLFLDRRLVIDKKYGYFNN